VLSGDTIGGAPARQAGEEVGIYAITLGTLAHPCYEITLAEAEFVILPDGATAIELLTPPAKTEYLRGEALSTEGITLSLLLQSGTSRPLALEDCTVSGYDPMHIGAQTVTLTYGLLSVTFEVMVEPDELIIADDRFLLSEEDVTLTVDSTSKPVTLSELLAALPEGYTAKLYQGDAEQDGGKRIGTGMTLTVLRGDTVCMTLTVIHRGDVNGDGRLTQTDAVIILRALVGKYTLSEAGAIAADVVGIGRLTQTDAVQILRWVLSYDRA